MKKQAPVHLFFGDDEYSVAAQARRLGLRHARLVWQGPKPSANLQAAARSERRDLLLARCRREGLLHLALAHHQDDQAETLFLNLARGSGLDGMAAMPALFETEQVRILRPLLTVPRGLLEATLRARGLGWIEDPSNRDPRFGRGQGACSGRNFAFQSGNARFACGKRLLLGRNLVLQRGNTRFDGSQSPLLCRDLIFQPGYERPGRR